MFNIEGSGILHIVNVLGQEIMAKEIDGKETVELPKGMYFVQLNGMTRKIVVE
ncbi:MAG: T9SS type A sorting domain-containing protein [Bacteroidales bacterium]|nr:T9SS type A sorting domain-containing protein [Bacteroidales bacterium]MBR6930646.1 T9SS type A sorting domain-containing protein [Bacteroidales bacterium]